MLRHTLKNFTTREPMDNTQKIKLVILLALILFVIPVTFMFYSKNPYTQTETTNVKKISVSNKKVLESTLPNNSYSQVEKSMVNYFNSNSSYPGELTVVDGAVNEVYGKYQFYLTNNTGDKTFRVDVVIAGFDTVSTYVNGVSW